MFPFALPVLTVGLFLLTFQRTFGARSFDVSAGADPLLCQHLFWILGRPEAYILIMPTFGIVSEVLQVFSRKPLSAGYHLLVAGDHRQASQPAARQDEPLAMIIGMNLTLGGARPRAPGSTATLGRTVGCNTEYHRRCARLFRLVRILCSR